MCARAHLQEGGLWPTEDAPVNGERVAKLVTSVQDAMYAQLGRHALACKRRLLTRVPHRVFSDVRSPSIHAYLYLYPLYLSVCVSLSFSICLYISLSPSLSLSLYLSICLSVYLSLYLSICLYVCVILGGE